MNVGPTYLPRYKISIKMRDIDISKLGAIDCLIFSSNPPNSDMLDIRNMLVDYMSRKYKNEVYNNKITTTINLAMFAINCLASKDANASKWVKYALDLITGIYTLSSNGDDQNGYEISASNYLAENHIYSHHDVFDSIRLSYQGILKFKPLPRF